jgi:hypothetical protein
MKTIIFVFALLIIGSTSAFAQLQPTVTIKTEGNRNKQVIVDNKTYTISNTQADNTITISDLGLGQHTLSVVRTNQANRSTTYFTVREGYDLSINISSNGSVSSSETRIGRGGTGNLISSTAFNRLLSQTKSKTGASARASFLETEFNKGNRRFTSKQATQLIQLVNSESMRLKLAKQSYLRISDQENFQMVFELLNSTASRNSLNDYLVSLQSGSNVTGTLTESQFNTIYNEVLGETNSERVYYLSNFFDREGVLYSTSQAKQLIQTVSGDQDRLNLAKKAYGGVTDKSIYYNSIYSLLSYSSQRLELQTYINNYSSTNSGSVSAMSETDFNKIYTAVRSSWTATSKFNLVSAAFNSTTNYFTTAQAKQLILQVSAEPDRLTAAKNAYDNIVDLANFSQLYEVIPSTNGKNELLAFVAARQGNVVAKIPKTDSEFTSMYKDVQFTFGLGAKYRSLTEIFNSATNYFTVAQAKQLIQLVSSESNRLELAKLSYNNITDPTNFTAIYDIFSSQSSKNELMNYVQSNAGLR